MRSSDRLGPYEIISQLGAGGMGEVYRARDTRLAREVAIKILPSEFANKKDRLQRFEQEARSSSALNHPNIITVFDIGSENGISYIAMEFVDGKTLRELLADGKMSLRRAISIAAQFADGLAKAHAAGIIHRDLKPENLMISQDNFVKILDFGLAKTSELPSTGGSVLSTLAKTGEGTILGTVGYMSPEQASGKLVDFRSDQFSFGSILYEMITGKRAFARSTAVQSLSAIIQEEPEPIAALNPQTPAPIRWIIERCLAKDPEDRYASTRDLARELQNVRDHFSDLSSTNEISGSAAILVHSKSNWRSVLPWILVTLLGTIFAVHMFLSQKKTENVLIPRNVEISIPQGYQLAGNAPITFAPDGSAIAFGTIGPGVEAQLWLRRLDSFDSVPLEGTKGATHPFWSPDSKSIAFFLDAEGTLNRLDVASTKSQIICKIKTSGLRTAGFARGGTWGADGTILFTPNSNAPIQRVSSSGGEPVNVTKLDPSILDGSHRFPAFLPDGQHFVFTVWSNNAETAARVGGVYLASLNAGAIRKLTSDVSQSILSGNDELLVYRNGSLVGLSFDSQKLQITDGEKEIISGPLYSLGSGAIYATTSNAGDLAVALSTAKSTGCQISWLDRTGKVTAAIGHQRLAVRRIIVSPEGNKFVGQVDGTSGQEIWIGDTEREIFTRLTRGGLDATDPVWSSDESQITFTTQQEGSVSVYIQPADGTSPPELLITDKGRDFLPTSWSSDSKYLFLNSNPKTNGKNEIWLYNFSEKKTRLVLSDPSASVSSGTLSPDGHWLAYVSDESGNQEIFLRPFPSLDRKWQISNSGGTAPHWRNDNHELLFIAPDSSVQSVKIESKENVLQASSPVFLFLPKVPMTTMDPSPDHKRFLAAVLPGDVRAEPIHLILGWKPR